MTLLAFLALTFGISLAGFLCIALLPGAKSPETALGLPFWLITVWGPSLAAIILATWNKDLMTLLGRTVQLSTIPIEVWGLILCPILLLALLHPFAPEETAPQSPDMFAVMVGINLVLGPLGEELGWRGVMQGQLHIHLGWLEASLLVGVVWLAWHLPLWTTDTPHSRISLHLFAIHCMLYAVLIGAAHTLSEGSILLHLTVNLAANRATFAGYRDPNAWFSASIWPYAALAGCATLLVWLKTGQSGFRLLSLTD